MERDFLGLNGKASVAPQLEEHGGSFQDSSGFLGGSLIQWPHANETPALPEAMPFNGAEECKLKRMTIDRFSQSGFQPQNSTDNSDINPKSFPMSSSKVCSVERRFPTTKHQNRRGFEQNLTNSSAFFMHDSSMARSFPLASHYSTKVATKVASVSEQQIFGGGTAVKGHFVTSTFGDLSSWTTNTSKAFSSASQLTIFYGGAVIVYDNVSMDMAQEIMLLARKGNNAAPTSVNSGALISNVDSIELAHAPLETNQLQVESQNQAPASDQSMPRAIPLARKASVARFMEKRKERIINYIPYSCDKKAPDSVHGSYDINSTKKSLTTPSRENSDMDSAQSSSPRTE